MTVVTVVYWKYCWPNMARETSRQLLKLGIRIWL